MPYTPDATDIAQPADAGVKASTAAAEFRTLKTYLKNTLLAGSAVWTGTPSFQTQAAADNSLKAATTAFVQQEIARLTGLVTNASGNVGIGTGAPGARLEVAGASNAAEIRLRSTDTTPANIRAYVNGVEAGKFSFLSSSALAVETAGTERMRIDSAGNVGVGTVSPASRLDVRGAGTYPLRIQGVTPSAGGGLQVFNDAGVNGVTIFTYGSTYAGGSVMNIGAGGSAVLSPGSGMLALATDPANSSPVLIGAQGTERIRVTAAGPVQFTGSNAARTVTINSGVTIKGDVGTWDIRYSFAGGTGTALGGFGLYGSGDSLGYYYIGADYATPGLVLSSANNVGIGTLAPQSSAILDVQSTAKGLRLPNMTTAQKTAIASPAAGLLVFDTTLAKACLYTGAAWQTITSA